MTPDDPRHGTNAGHRAHYTAGTEPCQPCRDAHAAYHRGLRARRYLLRTDRLYIDTTGTIRRLRALMALGWRYRDIDLALGHGATRTNYAHNLTRQARVHRDTATKVAAVYDRLSMQLGPSSRTRALARRYGWVPPLAWDDETIDDPAATPRGSINQPSLPDEVVILRILGGDNRVRATTAERREVCRRWAASGRALNELERLTGWKVGRYFKVREDAA